MDQPPNSWYNIDNIEQVDSPALVVYPGRVEENIGILLSMIDDPGRLRPHVKTHKTKEVTKLLLEAGVSKFKCATIAEAEMLAMSGAADVLLAYQPVGPKVLRFVSLIKTYPLASFSCLADNEQAAKQMAEIFVTNNLSVDVYIDLNSGMNRTGIAPGKEAIELFNACIGLEGIKPAGLHWYDGHINNADFQLRSERCNEAFSSVENLLGTLSEMGHSNLIVVAGGSPTFPIHCQRKKIECSPGTFVFWDKGYLDSFAEQAFLPAALVVTRIVSKPAGNKLCLDLGHKSIAAENELSKRVFFLNAPGLRFIGQSEEHLVVEADDAFSYEIGDVLYGLPFHICPTVALHERAYLVENRNVTGEEWKIIARNRRIAI